MIHCSAERRRRILRERGLLGIDFIEVDPDDRTRLLVYLIAPVDPVEIAELASRLRKRHVVITGGTRREVVAARKPIAEGDHLVVKVNTIGDRSMYTLTIEHRDFDQRLNRSDFSFTATCGSIEDCRSEEVHCPPEQVDGPLIDYLAKDFDTFRRQSLDHLVANLPDWSGPHPADFLTTIAEVIAYESDRLSYRQDVIANERTLGGARLRPSAARHARLVGYDADDGAAARTFLRVDVEGPGVVPVLPGARVFTRVVDPAIAASVTSLGDGSAGRPIPPGLDPEQAEIAARRADQVFTVMPRDQDSTVRPWRLDPVLNRLPIHTWADEDCCLPRGATEAVLIGDLRSKLAAGSYLLLQEIRGVSADDDDRRSTPREADPDQAFVVRLTEVHRLPDDHATESGDPLKLTRIVWDRRDALPRPLCVSDRKIVEPIAYAFANLVLVEHGRPVIGQAFDLPNDFADLTSQHPLVYSQALGAKPVLCTRRDSIPGRSDAQAWNELPAAHHLDPSPAPGLARIELSTAGDDPAHRWSIRPTLLQSDEDARHFVVELSNLRQASLRFGDGTNGRRPVEADEQGAERGVEFRASYMTGLAEEGNVGAGALAHLEVGRGAARILSVTNPVPAAGGRSPESLQQIKNRAPAGIRQARRAVRLEDFDAYATGVPEVQRARSRFEWTGSWSTVAVVADAQGANQLEADGDQALARELNGVRLAGYPVEIDQPSYVPLEVELEICVDSATDPWPVVREVRQALGSGCRPDGTPGFFHPDRLSFGQPIWLSDIVATAGRVEGVTSVQPRTFKRLFGPDSYLRRGVIPLGRFEIAQVDTDDARPEHGVLHVELERP